MPETYPQEHLRELQAAVEDALTRVPFYARWASKDPGASTPILERLRKLPTLSRRELRAGFPRLFTPAGKDLKAALESGEVELVATSGTTDDRVQVIWWQPWWNDQELGQYTQGNPLSQTLWAQTFREAVLTTPVCSAGVCHIGDLPMKERIWDRMLFLNQKADPAHWSAKDHQRMVEELNAYKPEALEADPAYLAALARYAVEKGVGLHQPRYIGLTYEFISRTYLAAIAAAFPGVPILDSYGSTEAGCLHLSCEHGRLHPNLGWTHADVLPLKPEHGGPNLGRLVATVLRNPWLKLVRYETSDLVRVASEPCACGRQGQSLERIEGRLKDVVFATDGSLVTVGGIDAQLAPLATDGLVQYQLVQESKERYLIRYIASEGRDAHVSAELPKLLRELFKGGEVAVQRETTIAPEPSGKYRLARTELPVDAASLFAPVEG